MKIAIDGSLLSGLHSGVELSILGLVTGLSTLPTEDTVLLYVGKKFDCPNLPAGCVKLRRSRGAGRWRLRRILWQQLSLPMYLRAEKVDVFHGPGYVLPAIGRVPSVVTVHDVIALARPELCTKSNVAHYRRVLPRSIRKAQLVIAPTRAVAARIVETLGITGDKIRVIPWAIDARFRPAGDAEKREVRAALGLPDPYILFVGNLEPKKNLERLVEAFFAAKQSKRLKHKLVLAGAPGWKCERLLHLIDELDIKEEIVFTGYVRRDFLRGLYSAADMFVFPSLIEGFGIPPLEAMACGAPVIISKDPALRETAGGAALEVEATDLRAIREAIEALAGGGAIREKLVEKGRARAAKFSWIECARRTLEVYHEALRKAKTEIRPEDLLQ
ncbi:MAG: glycosyltransferase family 4 protein [Planctomycetes bacterium]|nr:glycosyltransferase family 4 protein [Planctomycetota bacterium]